jgi:hypothetical protein
MYSLEILLECGTGKLILSSLITLEIKILAEAVPICPVNKFSANFINRASAVVTFCRYCILD